MNARLLSPTLPFALLLFALTPPTLGSEAPPAPIEPRLEWWAQARFGMFIHWGPVSLKGTEIGWSRGEQVPAPVYDQLYREFNPTRFDADAWARLAKAAGMKYLVFTTKHHDGFSMWHTGLSDYNIMWTPFGRDVVKELAAACRRHHVIFCTYHSICDWYHPDYPLGSPGGRSKKPAPNLPRYAQYLKGQVSELIRNYGPLGILWFDGEWEQPWTTEYAEDLGAHLRRLQPSLIINNRIGKGRAGMEGTTAAGAFAGDYDTPEQQVGRFNNQRPWETCMTLCQQWAWKPDDTMKSLDECLQTLVRCAGGDGNLLFNVGPMPTGEIEPRQVERLEAMGRWLERHGSSVYNTRGGPYKPGAWGASTHRNRTLYLHIFQWPGEELALPALDARVQSARLLTGGAVTVTQTADSLRVSLPVGQRQEIDTVIVLELDRPAGQLTPIAVPAAGSHPPRTSQ